MKKYIVGLLIAASVGSVDAAIVDNHRERFLNLLDQLEENGGALTEQECVMIKQKAKQIVNVECARELLYMFDAKKMQEVSLIGKSSQEIIDLITQDDVRAAAYGVDYLNDSLGDFLTEVSLALHAAVDAQDYRQQLHRSMAYLVLLGLEIETVLNSIDCNVRMIEEWGDTSGNIRFEIGQD